MRRSGWLHTMFLLLAVGLAMGLGGCAAPPVAASGVPLPFAEAAVQATDALVVQTQTQALLLDRIGARRSVVLDPMLDAGSGQQTIATLQLQDRVVDRMAGKYDAIEVLPFDSDSLVKARYLLTGTLTRVAAGQPQGPLRIDLALTELKSGTVVAHASSLVRDEGLDHTPLPYDRDTPVPTRDPLVEGYVRTTAAAAGQRADPTYLARLSVAPAITAANAQYNAGRYPEALAQYSAVAGTAGGEQLRVLNGIYLSSVKLGRTAEAEQAFGKIVAYGIANRQLGVKFLFNPNTTTFWSDGRISGPYPMWLHQIARASTDAGVCMAIVGHTSHTGPVAYNEALSLQRAVYIRQRLVNDSSALGPRTTTSGMGFRENIIGSGTDDAVDALDRRVEFKIEGCG
jgi:hypothetical protein